MSTCTAERSFSSMKRLKTPLRSFIRAFSISTMTDGRLRSIAILHNHKNKDVDIDDVQYNRVRPSKGYTSSPLLVNPLFSPLFYPIFRCSKPKTLEIGKVTN